VSRWGDFLRDIRSKDFSVLSFDGVIGLFPHLRGRFAPHEDRVGLWGVNRAQLVWSRAQCGEQDRTMKAHGRLCDWATQKWQ
jgi:hypothetical protein